MFPLLLIKDNAIVQLFDLEQIRCQMQKHLETGLMVLAGHFDQIREQMSKEQQYHHQKFHLQMYG